MSKDNPVTDYFDFDDLNKQLSESQRSKAIELQEDLERYKDIEECSDKDFKEMQAMNRSLLNTVTRLREEISRLKNL